MQSSVAKLLDDIVQFAPEGAFVPTPQLWTKRCTAITGSPILINVRDTVNGTTAPGNPCLQRHILSRWTERSPRMMAWVGLCLTCANSIGIIWAALFVLEWMRCSFMLSKLPAPAGGSILGQLSVLSRPDHHNVLTQWAAQLGGIYRMRLAHINVMSHLHFCTS